MAQRSHLSPMALTAQLKTFIAKTPSALAGPPFDVQRAEIFVAGMVKAETFVAGRVAGDMDT